MVDMNGWMDGTIDSKSNEEYIHQSILVLVYLYTCIG